jgi:hypothetical protein
MGEYKDLKKNGAGMFRLRVLLGEEVFYCSAGIRDEKARRSFMNASQSAFLASLDPAEPHFAFVVY